MMYQKSIPRCFKGNVSPLTHIITKVYTHLTTFKEYSLRPECCFNTNIDLSENRTFLESHLHFQKCLCLKFLKISEIPSPGIAKVITLSPPPIRVYKH